MQYYRSTKTGRILSEYAVKTLNDIYGIDAITVVISQGILEEIEPPSVADCLCHGAMFDAVNRYCEIHNCDRETAKKEVKTIRSDMSRFRGIYNKKRKKAKENVVQEEA